MYVKFQVIRYKNFLAVGNSWIEIRLDQNERTLIYGENGAGKSTILDALTFALFGKAFRNINKPEIVNSINGEFCVVELEFSIGQKQYKIVRGIKPNLFAIYIAGKLQDQTGVYDYQDFLEKNILKFNFKTFKQIMVLGSKSFVSFMKLPALDRRNVIEELLDIQIFSAMARVTRNKLDHCRDTIKDLENKISVTIEKIELQKNNLLDAFVKNAEKIKTNLQTIETGTKQIEILTKEIEAFQNQIESLSHVKNLKITYQDKLQQLHKLEAQIYQNLSQAKKNHNFFLKNDNCPTCFREIETDFKQAQIKTYETKQRDFDTGYEQITVEINRTIDILDDMSKSLEKINENQSKILLNQQKISQLNEWEKKLLQENHTLEQNSQQAEKNDNQLQKFQSELETLQQEKDVVLNQKKHLEIIAALLKDGGIKTSIVKQYLPVMNNYINKYLSILDFDVNFSLNENFEESIMARYRDKFAYGNFSDGQQLRLDLALLFAWRSVAKAKNSVDTNLLIMDEIIDSSLDNQGLEMFLQLISTMKDTNIFILSPKGDSLVDKFDHTIKFEIRNNFSEIV